MLKCVYLFGLLGEDEFKRRFDTALGTVRSAEGDLERGDYNWACFKAHQSAEFAVKGSPADYYAREDALQAIEYAKSIIGWVESAWRSLRQERA